MISRGDIYYADLSPVIGSEQGGIRPVLVLQNNKGNKFSTTVIVAPISCYFTWTNKDDWQSSISRKIRYFRWLFYEESQWGYWNKFGFKIVFIKYNICYNAFIGWWKKWIYMISKIKQMKY